MNSSRSWSWNAVPAAVAGCWCPAAPGDSTSGDTFQNAACLGLSWPCAAGSLFSTMDGLHTWNRAVFCGRLLKPAALKRAHTEKVIPGFDPTRCGLG